MATVQLQFTNNFYVWLNSLLLSNGVAGGTVFTSSSGIANSVPVIGTITCTDNTTLGSLAFQYSGGGNNYPTYGINSIPLSSFNQGNGSDKNSHSFIIGSNNTAFNRADTNLLDEITTGFSISLAAVHYLEDDISCLDYTVTINNTSENDIELYEIGLLKNVPAYPTTADTSTKHLLIARGVIEDGIIIAAGQSKNLVISLKMPTVAPTV